MLTFPSSNETTDSKQYASSRMSNVEDERMDLNILIPWSLFTNELVKVRDLIYISRLRSGEWSPQTTRQKVWHTSLPVGENIDLSVVILSRDVRDWDEQITNQYLITALPSAKVLTHNKITHFGLFNSGCVKSP